MSLALGVVILLVIIVVSMLWDDIRYALGLYIPTKWTCMDKAIGGTPIRRGRFGDMECMTIDGKNCVGDPKMTCEQWIATPPKDGKLLRCGPSHKAIWGVTGYDVPHWCSVGHANTQQFPRAYFKEWK